MPVVPGRAPGCPRCTLSPMELETRRRFTWPRRAVPASVPELGEGGSWGVPSASCSGTWHRRKALGSMGQRPQLGWGRLWGSSQKQRAAELGMGLGKATCVAERAQPSQGGRKRVLPFRVRRSLPSVIDGDRRVAFPSGSRWRGENKSVFCNMVASARPKERFVAGPVPVWLGAAEGGQGTAWPGRGIRGAGSSLRRPRLLLGGSARPALPQMEDRKHPSPWPGSFRRVLMVLMMVPSKYYPMFNSLPASLGAGGGTFVPLSVASPELRIRRQPAHKTSLRGLGEERLVAKEPGRSRRPVKTPLALG